MVTIVVFDLKNILGYQFCEEQGVYVFREPILFLEPEFTRAS